MFRQDLVRELADFIESNRGQWSSSDRLSLQLEHAIVCLYGILGGFLRNNVRSLLEAVS